MNDMIVRTSTSVAPWVVMPSMDKRYARVHVLEHFIDAARKAFEKRGIDIDVPRGIDIDVPRAIEEIEKKDLKAEDKSEKPKSDKNKAKDNKPKEEQKG